MIRSRPIPPPLAVLAIAIGILATATARAGVWRPVALSDSLGTEIDAGERAAYHLLPEVEGFVSARFLFDGRAYRLEYTREDAKGTRQASVSLSPAAWELTREHAALVERYRALAAASDSIPPEWQYRLALKYAAGARYDVSRPLLEDLGADYPGSPEAAAADSTLIVVNRVAVGPPGIYRAGPLHDRGGRTDLLIFAGYYGIWAGLAVPIWADAQNAEAYAAGLLIGGPASLLLASALTQTRGISTGSAQMISLGGNLGTWQGLGWSGLGDADGNQVVGIGLLSGLAGIASAVALTHRVHFTEGHAAVMNAGLLWGAWFGLAAAVVGGSEDDALLRASLIGSDVLVAGAGVLARHARLSKGRMRAITALGFVGTAFGFGLDLLIQPDADAAVIGIAALGSVAGLGVGTAITSEYDYGKTLAGASGPRGEDRVSLAPTLRLDRDAALHGRLHPQIGVRAAF
jgi:hypothetical protein